MSHIDREVSSIVVISDTHFGDKSQLLDDPELAERFIEALQSQGRIDEFVLLGDIVDLWVSTPVPALKKARHFIQRLTELPELQSVLYVPGNHDHQMFMNAFRLEMDMNIMLGKLETPRFMPAREYGDTVLSGIAHPKFKGHFPMVYPCVVRRVSGMEVVLAHGHHLDFFATRWPWFRTFWLSRLIVKRRRMNATLHDIEMANIPFCGAMSVAPWVPELVVEGLRFYNIISFFGKLFRSKRMLKSPLRDSLIKENYDEIQKLLPLFGHPEPDLFVFGHTHRPGIGKVPGTGTKVANFGSWTKNDEGAPSMTWLRIDQAVRLYALDETGPKVLSEEPL